MSNKVPQLLRTLGLDKYLSLFEEQEIDDEVLAKHQRNCGKPDRNLPGTM